MCFLHRNILKYLYIKYNILKCFPGVHRFRILITILNDFIPAYYEPPNILHHTVNNRTGI